MIESGNYVICLDNFFTGSKENIQHLVGNPNFELEERDIIWPYMKGVDEIYNLACPASPVHYQYDPIKTINTSVFGAVNMLELAKGVKAKLLQGSTSEVYGDPVKHPQTEEYWGNVNPTGCVLVMMKERDVRRHCAWIITVRRGRGENYSYI